jgi:hypothetical protein
MTTNAIYDKRGTATTFSHTAGAGVIAMHIEDVALGHGWCSAQWDRGEGAAPALYKWEAHMKWVDTCALGDIVRLYVYDADSGNAAADMIADAIVEPPETAFGNFRLFGQVIANLAANNVFYATGLVYISGRYVNVGIFNASVTKAMNATSDVSHIIFTPHFDDIQAAS